MELFWKFYLWLILLIGGIWQYVKWRERKQEERERALQDFRSNALRLSEAIGSFTKCLNTKGYFTNHSLRTWKEKYTALFGAMTTQMLDGVDSNGQQTIKTFFDYFTNAEDYRTRFNREFISRELTAYTQFFDNVEGRKLDTQQRTAIITDEDNNLIIAGAGSGKTTTIVGKVHYVLNRYNVNPESILLISFTGKSASTLSSRVEVDGVEAKTFHKFGKDVIASVDGKQPLIYDEDQFRRFIINTFAALLKDKVYKRRVTTYFSDQLKPEKSEFEFEKRSDYIRFLKDHNFKPYQKIQPIGKHTWYREVVKSVEECKIANFLLFNNLDYQYEAPYLQDTATSTHSRWRPDFTVTQNEKTVYIEHLGVRRNGDVPPFFAKRGESYQSAKDRYWKKIAWMREQSKKDGTIVIETYSYEMSEGILYDNLKSRLESHGIILRPKSPEEIWDIINDAAKDESRNFITLFQTFITLMKSNNFDIESVANRNRGLNDGFYAKRNAAFLELVGPIYKAYEKHLANRGEIDFSDMINRASTYIRDGRFKHKFSYVIVDEFQDISIDRYQLIKAIKDVNPSCKLFCVGDDWQSIYRFSGSDLALFKEFDKYFGYSSKSKIETTYRFHNPVLKLSSDFIQQNPNQEKKALRSASVGKSTKYEVIYTMSEDGDDDTKALQGILDKLASMEPNLASKEFLLLGRYNNDIKRIKNKESVFHIELNVETPAVNYSVRVDSSVVKVRLPFITVHKAKGLEADIVVVINCNAGKYGFPSTMSDDPVLNLLLSESDQYENGEERRIFYVGMTRGKERTYFIADKAMRSKFIDEIEVGTAADRPNKCPICATADLVRRSGTKNGKAWAYDRCSNWKYGCEYKKWVN